MKILSSHIWDGSVRQIMSLYSPTNIACINKHLASRKKYEYKYNFFADFSRAQNEREGDIKSHLWIYECVGSNGVKRRKSIFHKDMRSSHNI
jgi:hypothetical protein